MDAQQALFVMADTALRVLVIEGLKVAMWGVMAAAVTTYGVLLHRWLR